ncbi:hypothetical protein FPOAC2_13024 [Fusarium poae]|jgi:hypothetical protein
MCVKIEDRKECRVCEKTIGPVTHIERLCYKVLRDEIQFGECGLIDKIEAKTWIEECKDCEEKRKKAQEDK